MSLSPASSWRFPVEIHTTISFWNWPPESAPFTCWAQRYIWNSNKICFCCHETSSCSSMPSSKSSGNLTFSNPSTMCFSNIMLSYISSSVDNHLITKPTRILPQPMVSTSTRGTVSCVEMLWTNWEKPPTVCLTVFQSCPTALAPDFGQCIVDVFFWKAIQCFWKYKSLPDGHRSRKPQSYQLLLRDFICQNLSVMSMVPCKNEQSHSRFRHALLAFRIF